MDELGREQALAESCRALAGAYPGLRHALLRWEDAHRRHYNMLRDIMEDELSIETEMLEAIAELVRNTKNLS